MPVKPTPLHVRFWRRVDRRGPDECWPWTGGLQLPRGYGKLRLGGRGSRTVLAHRVAYALQNGPIPDGPDVHHRGREDGRLCETKLCCNGRHLVLRGREEHRPDDGEGACCAVVPLGKALSFENTQRQGE